MVEEATRLLFVYNADSGPVSALMDAVHKVVSPQTYSCSLCFITYGAVSMKGEWKEYIARLPYPSEFLHRDEFQSRWPRLHVPLPAILMQDAERMPAVLLGPEDMPAKLTVSALSERLNAALQRYWGQRE